jgi:Mg/Co/Ni transporter MgtE
MQDNIIQIIPADGWVAVFEENGEESAQTLVCFAIVEEAGKRAVRPMLANGKVISLADTLPHFVRVEELEAFEEEDEEEEEEGDEEEEDEEEEEEEEEA